MKKYLLSDLIEKIRSLFTRVRFEQHQYVVSHKEKEVGRMLVSRTISDPGYIITINFNAALDFIMENFVIEGLEECYFENGILKSSSVLRKVISKIAVNKHTQQKGTAYISYDGARTSAVLVREIRYNLMNILFLEPTDQQSLYSDNRQENLKVEKKSSNIYQISLPNGSFNRYTYRNGVCILIELKNSWAELVLKRIS